MSGEATDALVSWDNWRGSGWPFGNCDGYVPASELRRAIEHGDALRAEVASLRVRVDQASWKASYFSMRGERDDIRDLLRDGVEAMRLTREYVGEDVLPETEGWSWFDWTMRARASLGGMVDDGGETCECGHLLAAHNPTSGRGECRSVVYTNRSLGAGAAYSCPCLRFAAVAGEEQPA